METKVFLTVFATVFLAELGDKTQIATMLFAAKDGTNLIVVFIAASAALVATSAIGVLAGAMISQYVETRTLAYLAGGAFVLVGLWTIWQAAST